MTIVINLQLISGNGYNTATPLKEGYVLHVLYSKVCREVRHGLLCHPSVRGTCRRRNHQYGTEHRRSGEPQIESWLRLFYILLVTSAYSCCVPDSMAEPSLILAQATYNSSISQLSIHNAGELGHLSPNPPELMVTKQHY